MQKSKIQNFHEQEITSYNCFFSEVREVSHASLHGQDIPGSQLRNCWVGFQSDEIFIMSRGGTRFHLPMDQHITRVFPLVEGILIEFQVKQEIKLQEILYYQRNKGSASLQVEDEHKDRSGVYCYATLTRHPFNPLKLLGEFNNEQITGWYKVKEAVNFASSQVPLIISYNEQLSRNAIHVLLGNVADVKKEAEFAFVPSHTYSLKSLNEVPHFEVLTQIIFEQNEQGDRIVDVLLAKCIKRGHLTLYARTEQSQLLVYDVDFFGGYNSARLISVVQHMEYFTNQQLYSTYMFQPEPFKANDLHLLNEILKGQLNSLSDCIALVADGVLHNYYNGVLIASRTLQGIVTQTNNTLYVNGNDISFPPLINDPIDSLILRTLELSFEDDRYFMKCLTQYCAGSPIFQCLSNLQDSKTGTFFQLHLLYQECKLYELMRAERRHLSSILLRLARKLNKGEYIDYYLREGYQAQDAGQVRPEQLQVEAVYDIFSQLKKILSSAGTCKQVPAIYNRSRFVLNFFQLLADGELKMSVDCSSRESQMNSKYQHGKEHFYRTRYPLLSQKVYHLDYFGELYESELLNSARPQNKQQRAFIYLIKNNQGHNQLITYPQSIRATFNWLLRQMRRQLPYSLYEVIPKLGFMLIHRQDLYKNIQLYKKQTLSTPYHLQRPSLDDHIKTLVHTSTSQEYFLTSNASEMNKINNDLVFEEVDRLLSLTSEIKIKLRDIDSIPEDRWEAESQNILLKFANRKLAIIPGQGAFCFGTSRSFITDIIKIPKINLSGQMPNDLRINLDLKEEKEALIYWPEFHAGMAAGLRLSRHVIPMSEDHLKTWIFYQKPDTPKRDHSGFLLSLGLLGYLKCFSPTDIYQYLKPNNQFTSVAILLGVSASNIGKSDEALSKALILHIPVLLPPSIDVEIPINVQTSALIGVGLLHKGTCNRTMTEMTLSQIGKRPSSDKCLDRQGYSLAAGWALGMICLGMKDKKESFRDLQLQQRLIRFIEGGKVLQSPQSMISTNYKNESKCSSIMQGPYVNVHITAPAALLSISLMYLKSNDAELCAKITIPNSFNTIEECNPNHILLKTLAKNLIMWDSIGATREFILDQIPQLIRFIYENSLNKVYQRYYLVYNVSEIDYQTITTIYLSVMTGCVLAMAFKHAGTGSLAVVNTIKEHIEHLKNVRIIKCEFGNDPLNKNSIDQYEQFSMLSASLLALSIVMAGSCDIDCLKLIRIIRKKFQDSKVFHYGFSMAINMAIGFVFLGFGNFTFNREDMSIAALLISIFPQFPNSPSDNKWHLQALRHFYVLAMEQKIFHAVDVDNDKVVNVNARMTFLCNNEFTEEELHTPILLQESKKLTHIKIRDEDYFDVDFAFDPARPEPKAIYIKRKHFKDINPALLNPENVLATTMAQAAITDSLKQEIRFTWLLELGNFCKGPTSPQDKLHKSLGFLLPKTSQDKLKLVSERIIPTQFPRQLYYKLLKEDRLDMLQIYLTLQRQMQRQSLQDEPDSLPWSNISFLLNFEKWLKSNEFSSLIQKPLSCMRKILTDSEQMQAYFRNPHGAVLSREQYRALRIMQVPTSRDLLVIKTAIEVIRLSKENLAQVQMMLYLSYPECDYEILNAILRTHLK